MGLLHSYFTTELVSRAVSPLGDGCASHSVGLALAKQMLAEVTQVEASSVPEMSCHCHENSKLAIPRS